MTELRYPEPMLMDDTVSLRPWNEADVAAVYRIGEPALLPRFARIAPEAPRGEAAHRLLSRLEQARRAGEGLALAVADRDTDALLGTAVLVRFHWSEARGEIGYRLASAARGRGVATRAVMLLSRWALIDLGLARLALHTDTDNAPSQRVAERCGFVREGVLRSLLERDGRRHDVVVYSLLPADLRRERGDDLPAAASSSRS